MTGLARHSCDDARVVKERILFFWLREREPLVLFFEKKRGKDPSLLPSEGGRMIPAARPTEACWSKVHRRGQEGEEWQEAVVLMADALDNHGARRRRRCRASCGAQPEIGAEHLSTQIAVGNRDGCLSKQGQHAEAGLLPREVLAARELPRGRALQHADDPSNLRSWIMGRHGGVRSIPQGSCGIAAETPGRPFAAEGPRDHSQQKVLGATRGRPFAAQGPQSAAAR